MITINGLELIHFTDMKYPRAIMTPHPNVEYSIFGAVIGDGPFYAPKHIWTITVALEEDEMRRLMDIYYTFDTARRSSPNAYVMINDTNQYPFMSTKVWFTSPPTFEWAGIQRITNFVLVEV